MIVQNSARCAAICSVIGLVFANPALGQSPQEVTELPLEQLLNLQVSAASKFPQKLSEAPANVTVIAAADIAAYGYRTLTDILNSVPGLHVFTDRAYDFLGVRGFARSGDYNGRVLLVVDGYRINDPVYSNGTIGSEFILDVDLIDRVEFVHGPGSSIYGSNAFFGVINVVSKKGKHLKGVVASVEAASADTYKQRLSYGQRFGNGLDLVASATNYDTRGEDLYFPEYDSPASNNGVAQDMERERFHDFLLKAEWRGLSFEAAYENRLQRIPTGFYGVKFNDPRCTVEDIQSLVQLRYDTVVGGDLDLQVRIYNGRYDYNGNYPFDYAGDGTITVNVDGSRAGWWGSELKLVSSGFDRHKLVMGAEYTRNHDVNQFNHDRDPYALYNDDRRSNTSLGLYLQDDIRLTRGLAVVAGVRADQVGDYRDSTSPRVALIYRITPESTLKLAYGTAFRAPNAFETFLVFPGIQKANPDLEPETTENFDLIFEQVQEGRLRWSVSAFHNTLDDLITQELDPADGLLVYRNLSNAKADGAQVAGELLLQHGVRARTSYAWQRVIDRATGAVINNSPEHLAKLNLSAPLPRTDFSAGLEWLYTGARGTLAGGEVGGYSLVNLTVRHTGLLPNLRVSASAYNLFDKDYGIVGSEVLSRVGLFTIAGDGRAARLKLEYTF